MQQRAFRPARQATSASTLRRPVARAFTVVCKFNTEKQSRIGRAPIALPKGVQIELSGQTLKVKGPNGTLQHTFVDLVELKQEDGKLMVERREKTREANAMHGLSRSLANNMVVGVSTGFQKRLDMVGTGYRASVTSTELTLNVGYSKPRVLPLPAGIKVVVEKNTGLIISGYDKVAVGDFCALVRRQRPPEPYKGKGIRYQGEVIKLKEGKAAGKKK